MSEMSESADTDIDTAPSTGVFTSPLADDETIKRDEDERQALTPTPSEPSTPTTPEDSKPLAKFPFSTANEHARKSSTNLSALSVNGWDEKSMMSEPDWEMITIGKVAEPGDRFSDAAQVRVVEEPSPIERGAPVREVQWHPLRMNSLVDKNRAAVREREKKSAAPVPAAAPKQGPRQRGLSNTSHKAADLTATMATQRLPGKGEVQIARSMSVTKATARPALRTSPRGVERTKGENLVETGKALTPMLVTVPAPLNVAGRAKGHKPAKSYTASIVSQ